MLAGGESVTSGQFGPAPQATANGATRLEDLLFCGFQTEALTASLAALEAEASLPPEADAGHVDERAVAIAFAMERRSDGTGDVCCPGPAAPGPILAFGGTPLEYLRHVTGRGTGPNGGRGGGLSWTDKARGLIGAGGPPGTMTQVLAGAAMAFRRRGEPRAALVFEGGRAADTGGWHEGLNLAAAQKAPLIVVMAARRDPGVSALAHRGNPAEAYGLTLLTLHDEPLSQLLDRVGEARSHALGGGGPVLIRLMPLETEARWQGLHGLVEACREHGLVQDAVLEELPGRARGDVDHALRRLSREPAPDGRSALVPVLAGEDPIPPWTRQDPAEPGNRTPLNPVGGLVG